MAGFRSLFKVRNPGNGDAFQKKVEAAGKKSIPITNKGNGVPNGGDKKVVSSK